MEERKCVICDNKEDLENRMGTLFTPICIICKPRIQKIIEIYKEQERTFKAMKRASKRYKKPDGA